MAEKLTGKRSNLLLGSETIGMKAEVLERPAVVEEVDHAHDPAGVDLRLDQDHAHGLVDEHHLSLDLGHASGQEVHLRDPVVPHVNEIDLPPDLDLVPDHAKVTPIGHFSVQPIRTSLSDFPVPVRLP